MDDDIPWRDTPKARNKGKGKRKGKGKHNKMGNEESRMVDPGTPSRTLDARTIEAVAKYIKDGQAEKIVVMVRFIFGSNYNSVLKMER